MQRLLSGPQVSTFLLVTWFSLKDITIHLLGRTGKISYLKNNTFVKAWDDTLCPTWRTWRNTKKIEVIKIPIRVIYKWVLICFIFIVPLIQSQGFMCRFFKSFLFIIMRYIRVPSLMTSCSEPKREMGIVLVNQGKSNI
jgi:hypothetical protein